MSSKHFCLKWTKFQTSILNAFESLQNTEDLADVTLTCEGISLKAHKFILSACSPYFRTVFKENPCPHPIVILKDVTYVDLIAIVNFMYHGEVMVSEEQLPSFLQTAMILQVSGLINNEAPYSINQRQNKKVKTSCETTHYECPTKKIRSSTTPKCTKTPAPSEEKITPTVVDQELIKPERTNAEMDILENKNNDQIMPISSILEAALDVKTAGSSILERSLTSHHQQPTSSCKTANALLPVSCEKLNSLPDIFIPRKPPENEMERLILRSSSESSSSPSTFIERPHIMNDLLQPTIKIEGVEEDAPPEMEMELSTAEEAALNFSKTVSLELPHHSSQCGNCPHCGKIYSNQSALKYHVRLVHSDLTNMYCCHLCPESFDYREGYKKHMAEIHSVRN